MEKITLSTVISNVFIGLFLLNFILSFIGFIAYAVIGLIILLFR